MKPLGDVCVFVTIFATAAAVRNRFTPNPLKLIVERMRHRKGKELFFVAFDNTTNVYCS
jgi:hypothetical protein